MDKEKFFDSVRPHINLTTQNVQGFNKFLDYLEQTNWQINYAAYGTATGFWETAQTMHPVREAYWLSENWRKKNLRYYPWYGRGLIQTTWKRNYIEIAKAMNLPGDTFTKNPDLLLEWEYALPALFVGMETGLYTGKSVSDYIDDIDEPDDEDYREYVNARRVVNGTDKAKQIADLALIFEKGLKAAGYNQKPKNKPTQLPTESVHDTPMGDQSGKQENALTKLLEAFMRILANFFKNKG